MSNENQDFSSGMKVMFEEYEKELAKRTKREKLFQAIKNLINIYTETDTERIECELTFLNNKEDDYSEIVYRHKFIKKINEEKVRIEVEDVKEMKQDKVEDSNGE